VIKGAQQFLAEGLTPPSAVMEAVQAAKDEVDVLGQFIKEECTVTEGERMKVSELRDHFIDWAKANGYKRAPAARTFNRELREAGFDVRVSTGKVNWVYGLKHGIVLVTEEQRKDGKLAELFGT